MKFEQFESIVHPTDFSPASDFAFAHALRIAVAARALIRIVHVERSPRDPREENFPRVRATLANWKLLNADATESDVVKKLGVNVGKNTIGAHDASQGLLAFLEANACDLLVMASHERTTLQGWFKGSIGEFTARAAHASTLFIKENRRGFVDQATGDCSLKVILIPVDSELNCAPAWRRIIAFASLFTPRPRVHLMHVGSKSPVVRDEAGHAMDLPIELRAGPVVETILAVAREVSADLIAMPTAGHHGVFDALRGSVTERVLHHASCPVLAVPTNRR